MGTPINPLESLQGDMGVNLGGCQLGVAQEFLNTAEIGAAI
jgi:hypothetical protein